MDAGKEAWKAILTVEIKYAKMLLTMISSFPRFNI